MAKLPWKELDILVNNCGTNVRKRAEDFGREDFDQVFNTNFMSCMRLASKENVWRLDVRFAKFVCVLGQLGQFTPRQG